MKNIPGTLKQSSLKKFKKIFMELAPVADPNMKIGNKYSYNFVTTKF